MSQFFDLLMWTVVAAIIVTLVVNGRDTSMIISNFGSFWTKETSILAK